MDTIWRKGSTMLSKIIRSTPSVDEMDKKINPDFIVDYVLGETVWCYPEVREGTLINRDGEIIKVHCHIIHPSDISKAKDWFRTAFRINHPNILRVYWMNDDALNPIIFTERSDAVLCQWVDSRVDGDHFFGKTYDYLDTYLANILKTILEGLFFVRSNQNLVKYVKIKQKTIFLLDGDAKLTWLSNSKSENCPVSKMDEHDVLCFVALVDGIFKQKQLMGKPKALDLLLASLNKYPGRLQVLQGAPLHPAFMNATTKLSYRVAIWEKLKDDLQFGSVCAALSHYDNLGLRQQILNLPAKLGLAPFRKQDVQADWTKNIIGHVVYTVMTHNNLQHTYHDTAKSFIKLGRDVGTLYKEKFPFVDDETVERELEKFMENFLPDVHLALLKKGIFIQLATKKKITVSHSTSSFYYAY